MLRFLLVTFALLHLAQGNLIKSKDPQSNEILPSKNEKVDLGNSSISQEEEPQGPKVSEVNNVKESSGKESEDANRTSDALQSPVKSAPSPIAPPPHQEGLLISKKEETEEDSKVAEKGKKTNNDKKQDPNTDSESPSSASEQSEDSD